MTQEIFEEAAEKRYPEDGSFVVMDIDIAEYQQFAFIEGAKWYEENTNINALEFEIAALKSLIQDMDATIKSKYSEEEVLILLHERDVHNMHFPSTFNKGWKTPKEWFKKK